MSRSWFNKPLRVLQFNIEDRYGASLLHISGSDLARLAHDLGANVLVLFARDPWGRAFYLSKIRELHPKLRTDLIKEAVEEGRKLGIKVVVMVGHTADQYMYRKHTEWAQVNYRGETILLEHAPYYEEGYVPEWPQMCINSPFMNVIKEEVKEVLELGVDGVFLDSFRYQPDIERACYCRWCRERFLKEHGYEMPKEPNWRDSRWRELWDWRYRVVVEKLREVREVVKSRGGDEVLFMYNSHPGGWAGRTNRVVEEGRDYLDMIFAECSEADHQPPGFITEMVKLTRAMARGKPVTASRNYFFLYRTVVPTTPLAIRQGLRENIVGGGHPWALIFSNSYIQDRSSLEAIKEVFNEHERLEEYIDGAEPVKYVGIVVSNRTRDHYGRDKPEHYVDEVRGFYYALTHSHVPVEFIAERDLSDLSFIKSFNAIVLANTVCLGKGASNSLSNYVREGGGLVATYLSTTCDEECVDLYEFSLREVFGASVKGLLKSPWSYVIIKEKKHPIVKELPEAPILVGDMSYSFLRERVSPNLGWHVLIEPEGSLVLGNVGIASSEWGFEYTLGRSPPAYAGRTELPAVVVNSVSDGLSTYFTWQLGRHYWRVGLPTYRKLILNAVSYVGGEPPVRAEAPETLHTEFFRQGERYVIHLLNHTYNQRILSIGTGRTKQPLPGYSTSEAVHPPREVIPVSDVRILVSGVDPNLRYSVYSPLNPELKLSYEVVDGVALINVPGVKEYEVVVFEPRA